LAGDLHDGFQQALAGAMYQVDSALTCADELPEVLKKRLGGADAALKEAQKGLREVLWGLTEEGEGANAFGDLLRHVVSKRDHWQDLVTVRDVGEVRPVPPAVVGHLIMLFQEAVGNAIAHSQAKHVEVEVRFHDQGLALAIVDDGVGFDVQAALARANGSHFGLRGMRRRMKELGGKVTIESEPGGGTRVTVFVGLKKAMPAKKSPKRGMELTTVES
jgi:signal transduction histidine kinase